MKDLSGYTLKNVTHIDANTSVGEYIKTKDDRLRRRCLLTSCTRVTKMNVERYCEHHLKIMDAVRQDYAKDSRKKHRFFLVYDIRDASTDDFLNVLVVMN